MKDSLGDRMKDFYESRYSHYLPRRQPLIIRVDGKAFHTYTKGLTPFNTKFRAAMNSAAISTMGEMMGAQCAYIQSDECSFLLRDYTSLLSEAWFDYNQSKIESITAALFSSHFNLAAHGILSKNLGVFDARAFSLPREEVTNYFLWRIQDCKRNSLQILCQQHFSHKQLQGKNADEQLALLKEKQIDWLKDVGDEFRLGTFIHAETLHKKELDANYNQINEFIDLLT